MQAIREKIKDALSAVGATVVEIPLEHTADFAHGDYATSAALAYAKQLKMSPRDLAQKLVDAMGAVEGVSKIEIAGPGFINFTLDPKFLVEMLEIGRTHQDMWGGSVLYKGKKILLENTYPNPFK
jgi:arginyl-tRNA synthetase